MTGDEFNFGNQHNESGATGIQGKVDTLNINHGTDPWKPVEDYIQNDIPQESREQISEAVAFIKTQAESDTKAPESEWSSVIEVLQPYQPLIKLVTAAAPSIATFFGGG